MSQIDGSLVVSTYQAGKLVLLGWDGRQVTALLRDVDKPLGLAVDGPRIAAASRHQVLLFADAPLLAADFLPDAPGRYDALFLPRAAYYTGDLNTHDIAYGSDGLWLVNTRFSCLAAISKDVSFAPRWKPPFIREIVPEDRCHLNGLAMRGGQPAFVTALGESDQVGGWRERKRDGGVVIDVASGEVVLRGLSMPHSPRWYDGALWLLNSGAGEFLVADLGAGRANLVCVLPGYLRGLAFLGPYAVLGLSKIREKHIFGDLPVAERFPKLLCGVAVVDLRTGRQVGFFEFTEGCEELYDVQFLHGARRPMLLTPDQEEARQAFTSPRQSYWLRQQRPLEGKPADQ